MSQSSEPIAIIGMSARFSGEASSVEGFWEMMRDGRTGHGKVPPSRYGASAWYHPSHERKGGINHDSGFFLQEDPSLFDAPFFSITSKEAAGMDPAHRLSLEVAYEAFENGGIPMESLAGSSTAVYSGCMTNDYELLSTRDIYDMPHNSATGNGRTMLANRISWFFDLRGPSVMLDTACSSSLTALHLAVQALRGRECSMALVTGASLILHPSFTQRLSYMHMLSRDGISYSFDERANGYGRGEGLGAILLKPLNEALAAGDPIRAIVRATGANQDGRTPGITMPSASSQADLIRAVYAAPGMTSMKDTPYFEAHGTGTPVGDPTELSAIGETLGSSRGDGDEPCYVGSVKSNIGHTEGAAGVASVIKTVLCLENAMLVPNAGFEKLNPRLRLDEWKLRLNPNTAIPWPQHLPQRVSINSFGFGGSNAHAVLESKAEYLHSSQSSLSIESTPSPQLVVFSTHDRAGIGRVARKWTNGLRSSSKTISMRSLAYTMATRRSRLPFRSFAVADSLEELHRVMEKGLPDFSRASRHNQHNVCFVFTGQGAQWARMGIELLQIPVVADSLRRAHETLSRAGCPWDIIDEIRASAETSRIDQPDRSQPICSALQIALVDLLASWGIHPRATVGHSSGEIAAAYAAGYLSHEDAMRVSYSRGFYSLQAAQRGQRGGMLATGVSSEQAQKYLFKLQSDFKTASAVIACVNSPSSTTISGDIDIINQLEEELQKDGHFARKLRVDTAYHSPHMNPIADDYERAMRNIQPEDRHQGKITMISSVTMEQIQPDELVAAYWVRNMLSPVQFAGAISKLPTMTEGKSRRRPLPVKWTVLTEIGPHSALKGPVIQTLQSIGGSLATLPYLAPVQRKENALQTALQMAGSLWSIGYDVDLPSVNQAAFCCNSQSQELAAPEVVTSLPSYPWNHQTSFWHEPIETKTLKRRQSPRHDLLGAPLDFQNDLAPRWRHCLNVSENPWIADHIVAGTIIYPAAGSLAMVIEAARQLADSTREIRNIEFQDLSFLRGVVIPRDQGLESMLEVTSHTGLPGWYEFKVFTLPGTSWELNVSGMFTVQYQEYHHHEDYPDWNMTVERVKRTQVDAQPQDTESVFQWLSQIGGVTLGPSFRTFTSVSFKGMELCASVVASDTQRTMPDEYQSPSWIHPTVLDAIFQAAVLSSSNGLSNQRAQIPVEVERLVLSAHMQPKAGDSLAIHAMTCLGADGESRSECLASDSSWSLPGIVAQGIRLGRVPVATSGNSQVSDMGDKKYSSIIWDQHLDSALKLCDKTVIEKAHSISLSTLITRMCHTNGDSKALIITHDISQKWVQSLQSVAPKGNRGARFLKLSVTLFGQDSNLESISESIHKALPGSQVLVLPPIDDLNDFSSLDGDYDMIIVDEPRVWDHKDVQDTMDSIISLLAPEGYMALKVPSSNRDVVQELLQSFSSLHNLLQHNLDEDFVMVCREPDMPRLDAKIYILVEDIDCLPQQLLSRFKETFKSMGSALKIVGLDNVAELAGKTVISLLEFQHPWISSWAPSDMEKFQVLLQANHIIWLSQYPDDDSVKSVEFGATAGLLRTVRNEHPDITLVQVHFSWGDVTNSVGLVNGIIKAIQLTLQGAKSSRRPDLEFRLEGGQLLVPRIVEVSNVDDAIQTTLHGPRPRLSSLRHDSRALKLQEDSQKFKELYWDEDRELAGTLAADEVEIDLRAVTVTNANHKAGVSPETKFQGQEAVGTVVRVGSAVERLSIGNKVIAITTSASGVSTRLRLHQSMVLQLPSQITEFQALSMPAAYTLAYHGIFTAARLTSESSLLVVGSLCQTLLAIIDCSLASGIKSVYVAVDGSEDTREQISTKWGCLRHHVFPITGNLVSTISAKTNGKGVDSTLCLHSGYAGRVAASCLTWGGSYIDLSEGEMKLEALPARFPRQGCVFIPLSLQQLLREPVKNVTTSSQQLAFNLIINQKAPTVESYPVFPASKILDALQHSRQAGVRVIINLQAPGKVLIMPPAVKEVAPLSAEYTYLLAGGLGTLGLAFAETLVDLGARHLVFLSRSGDIQDEAQEKALLRLRDHGCRTETIKCDISKESDMHRLMLYAWDHEWRIKGVLQCTTVLRDAMFNKMTFDKWIASTEPKIRGTKYLHHILPLDLDFFVTLSSIASVIGNMGQANYSAGNSFMDAFMVWRQHHGLPGHSINIGLVPDASGRGDLAETPDERRKRYSHLEGTEVLTHELKALLRIIVQGKVSVPPQIIAGLRNTLSRDGATASWKMDRRLDHRIRFESTENATVIGVQAGALLKSVKSQAEAVNIVNDAMREYLAAAMATTAEGIDPELPLSALGVDSLKATEVQSWVSREMGAELSSFEFLGSQPLKSLADKIAISSTFVKASC